MTTTLPTRGQLERSLSQQIQALYRSQLGHRVSEVDCALLETKIAIVLEQSLTQPEQLLAEQGKDELVNELHTELDAAIRPQLKELIEAVVGVPVIDLLSDSTLKTARTGMIVMLAEAPQIRDAASRATAPTQASTK
ncbi:DUF2294 domain-containing protein [Stenomitos frigidus]|uniref:Na+-translocating membrane potential-generating system MpsC domain-containing protein n=1 Tax=Stenomitos frigidus ULC18 TaxID=2107698 RepID=A0A2T1EBH8_9CYAN|nr:DUF2294 domain-containing protein [Stenomitos frigidus]PSB30064.1 hypothetical protein C7B82_09840 [Stenomitos frigidus ULC18]